MHVTKHAHKRIRERNGANKKSIDKIVLKALEDGVPHCRTKGRLNKWVTHLYFQTRKANNIRIYGDKAYLFSGSSLITVIQIPPNITKDMKFMIISEEEYHQKKENAAERKLSCEENEN